MTIRLFKHNQTAYQAALKMLETTGKAAVIHPTGTGKSFIGFKLCEDFPEKTICWLSPSEYIFKTQVENLLATGGIERKELENVRFYTYAKLMSLTDEELAEIQPDYIILDEFHRCGAQMWGRGVQNLLTMYHEIPVLGFSATAIRYLDNQRDMSDELFEGNIASEMTLGEAIVRGILNPPKYVLSVFSYQKDLEKYERWVRTAKSKVVRDEGEKQLNALRRALDQADGLNEIFHKHMENRIGKYIVFCANHEHMKEMLGKAPEWFGKIDKNPHIYSVYSDDPATSREFQEFKADRSEHLKLLYCIDMLNEGVHVEDVDGVVLLRPTVSPIIYKQQIGRALSAGKKMNAVIFDIVLNIENLYSIGTIEEEMQIATSYYHFTGQDQEIVNEHFEVIDEVQDCIALFKRLDETLSASWDLMYECARQYYVKYGDLNVPVRYRTEEGYGLGQWILTQRRVYTGEKYGVLGEERIRKLEKIGMIWDSYRDLSWERYYREARKYYEEHGNLNITVNEVTESGIRLGAWICQLRTYRKSGIQKAHLTEERIEALNQIGMVWDVPDYLWEENFAECMQYYREHGNLDISSTYCSPRGLKIGSWLRRQRLIRKGKTNGARLTQEQIARLDSIGMVWKTKPEQKWEKGYTEARSYYEIYGNLNVLASYVSPSGYKLGNWIADQRERGRDKQSQERRERLDAIGMVWVKPDPWEVRYRFAKDYYEEHGNLNVPSKYRADGIWLAKWLNEQKQIYAGKRKGKTLSDERVKRLEAIGMDFASVKGKRKPEQETSRVTCGELDKEPGRNLNRVSDRNPDGEPDIEPDRDSDIRQDRAGELWYVAQVRIGSEESIRRQCIEKITGDELKDFRDCYVFYYEEKRHVRGEWVIQEKVLFPGYVFFVAKEKRSNSRGERLKELEEELRNVDGVQKFLGINKEPAALTDEEICFLKAFGGEEQTVEMSEGVIEQSEIRVYSGPLVGREKYIRKVDRHKRRAFVEMPMFGKMQKMQVGLEIVAKT